MQVSFTYDKKKVLQALRYHFIWQPEIRILLILVIVFDIATAILYMVGKIRPEPFLLGSFIWLIFIVSFWFILPNNIYKKAETFKDKLSIEVEDKYIVLRNQKGYVEWKWDQFTRFFESPHFFHLYFSAKSFFLLPKENMSEDFRFNFRNMLKEKITATK